MEGNILAGLDIGSSKVCIVVGVPTSEGIDIIGIGQAVSNGIRNGSVVSIESTTEAIKKAKEEAELMSGHPITHVWLGIGGSHVQSFNSKGMVAIRNKEVMAQDITRVIDAAKAVAVPSDREVLHVIPRTFKIDAQDNITDPVGMSGVRLESSVQIITAGKTAIQNAVKCAEKAGLKITGMAVNSLASSLADITEEEKNLGVAVVDVGGGTSDTIIYAHGSVAHLSTLPIGGSHITNDVAIGLRTPQANAEVVKKKFGSSISAAVNPAETIEVDSVAGRDKRTVYRRHLCEIIEPRSEEILAYIREDIKQSGLMEQIGSGVVLTGGVSQLDGFVEMAEFIFDMPVRKGTPLRVGGLTDVVKSPAYSTAVGLLFYGITKDKNINKIKKATESHAEGLFSNMMGKIRGLIDEGL